MGRRRQAIFQIFLDRVERIGNKLPHPVTLFALAAALVALLSALLQPLHIQVQEPGENGSTIAVKNLLDSDGITYIFTHLTDNFLDFAPLGVVLVTMLGIGLAERTGMINALLKGFILAVPRPLVTAGLVFAGILSSVAIDAGYVILPPLGALLFLASGRHPLAGLAAAFASVSAGYGANLFLSGNDVLLGELTIDAASRVDSDYAQGMNLAMNWYFIALSVFWLTALGTWVTERIIVPHLGHYDPQQLPENTTVETAASQTLQPEEKDGLKWGFIWFLVAAVLLALLVLLPHAPLQGSDGSYMARLIQSPFMKSLVPVITILFFVPSLAYGIVTGRIRSDRDVAHHLADSLGAMGIFMALAFTAGQFVAFFDESNLGSILAIRGADFLQGIHLSGIPLILLFIVITAGINLFIGSASAKWAILAPIFVPILMHLGYSPELTQTAYRIADSTTNIITPLLGFYAVIIAFAQRYDKNAGIGTLIALMLPYSMVFMAGWVILLVAWMLLDIPLGPGAPITYP